MKVWLVEIFIYNLDDEYGYICNHYRKNRVFDQEVKARNYLRDFRRMLKAKNKSILYWEGEQVDIYSWYEDESTITEMEI